MTGEIPRFIKQGEEFIPNPVYFVPQKVVLYFFQHWGQSMQERLDILNEAIKLAGFKNIKAEVTSYCPCLSRGVVS